MLVITTHNSPFLKLLSFKQSHHMIKLYFTVKFWEDTERLEIF